jgi:hypothetical protein
MRKTTFEDYDIDLANPQLCPRCDQNTLNLKISEGHWECFNQDCLWRGRLRDLANSTALTITEAAPDILGWRFRGVPKGLSTGWDSLDHYIRLLRGEWTCVTGYPGHGKSHWVDEVLINLMAQGWNVAMFSPENIPYERQVKKLLQKFLGKRFEEMTKPEIYLGQKWLYDKLTFIEPVEFTFEAVMAQFKKIIRPKKVKAIVIDPWNEIEHAVPKGMNYTDYTGRVLMRFRRFCQAMHVHGIIVAHPSKIQVIRKAGDENSKRPVVRLSDISGSSHFENKCYFGVSLWRDAGAEGDLKHLMHVHILKARNEDAGKVGVELLKWEPKTTRFREAVYDNPQASHGDKLKAEYAAKSKTGRWEDYNFFAANRENADLQKMLKLRSGAWSEGGEYDYKVGRYKQIIFETDDFRAVVNLVFGPGGAIEEYSASLTFKAGGEHLEEGFEKIEDALTWCEQTALKGMGV